MLLTTKHGWVSKNLKEFKYTKWKDEIVEMEFYFSTIIANFSVFYVNAVF
jgi:hypothetical protein